MRHYSGRRRRARGRAGQDGRAWERRLCSRVLTVMCVVAGLFLAGGVAVAFLLVGPGVARILVVAVSAISAVSAVVPSWYYLGSVKPELT